MGGGTGGGQHILAQVDKSKDLAQGGGTKNAFGHLSALIVHKPTRLLSFKAFGNRPSIYILKDWYDGTLQKSTKNSNFEGDGVFASKKRQRVKPHSGRLLIWKLSGIDFWQVFWKYLGFLLTFHHFTPKQYIFPA